MADKSGKSSGANSPKTPKDAKKDGKGAKSTEAGFGKNQDFIDLFNMFDSDGSGIIDEDEYKAMMKVLGIQQFIPFPDGAEGLTFSQVVTLCERLSRPLCVSEAMGEAFEFFSKACDMPDPNAKNEMFGHEKKSELEELKNKKSKDPQLLEQIELLDEQERQNQIEAAELVIDELVQAFKLLGDDSLSRADAATLLDGGLSLINNPAQKGLRGDMLQALGFGHYVEDDGEDFGASTSTLDYLEL